MNVIRGYEDVTAIMEDSLVVIWGAGVRGRTLLQEIRVNNIENVYIYDENSSKTEGIKERIFLEDIENEINKISFVIAVADDRLANEISDKINRYNNLIGIYRYIPKDVEYLENVLNKEGFYNGKKKCKALDGFQMKELLKKRINNKEPFLFSRWGGGVEGRAVYEDLAGIFIESTIFSLKNNAGFYPLDEFSVHKFAEYSINAAKEIDILLAGLWCRRIEDLYRLYSPNAILVTSSPFWEEHSWTSALKGRKVLVIHPFAPLMEKQYMKREKLFEIPDILPEMELTVYQAVQSMDGNPEFASWFDALDKMKEDISGIDFDIALLGCGAYGMPLGAFIKSELHKKAIHIGGSLQLLFGIKGKRWEGNGHDLQYRLYNEYWVRPSDDLKPKNYQNVEDGCYW